MSASIRASRACASTLLFHSLRLHAFRGAVPHLLLVVDRVSCVQQKTLVEGYVRVLCAYEAGGAQYLLGLHEDVMASASASSSSWHRDGVAAEEDLFISLQPNSVTPCGSAGFSSSAMTAMQDTSDPADAVTPLSYSILPFESETFMETVKRLQRFFRHCGDGQSTSVKSVVDSRWSAERFAAEYTHLHPVLGPLLSTTGVPLEEPDSPDSATAAVQRCSKLFHGPPRELLGCVLIQQNAFQNEMRRYRLRLSLFDLGIRVAEHCHLLIMSAVADKLAAEGHLREALADDQVYSYARSCAFRPEQAQTLARAIADAIDLHSWRRAPLRATEQSQKQDHFVPTPPPSLMEALQHPELRAIFNPGALRWYGGDSTSPQEETACVGHTAQSEMEVALRCPIEGPGLPLSIVSRDTTKVLTFSGGMEDCLTNTGYYVAAYAAERNDVTLHRERFHTAMADVLVGDEKDGLTTDVVGGAAIDVEEEASDAKSSVPPAAVHGRLKKKDYLAQLKTKGPKPNKQQHGSDQDEEEDGTLGRTCVVAGSCISNSIGGTFPIGEVISESFDLSQLNGRCDVFAYPDVFKQVTLSRPHPFTMTIERGVVTHISDGAPSEFLDLLSLVRQVEGDCYVRELGIGLNPYVGVAHMVNDVTTFERQWGIHLSLGQRHPLFVKQRARCNADGSVAAGVRVEGPVLRRKAGKYHIDVFIDAAQLCLGDAFAVDFTKGIAIP